MTVVKNQQGYTNILFQANIPERVTLLYDAPLEREGQYGKFYIFSGLSEDEQVGTFLVAETNKGENFKSFYENLMEFKAGDTLEIVKTEEKAKNGRNFFLYKITKIGEKDITPFIKNRETSNPNTVILNDTEQKIVNDIKEQIKPIPKESLSNYKTQLTQQLVEAGINEVRASYIFDNIILKGSD